MALMVNDLAFLIRSEPFFQVGRGFVADGGSVQVSINGHRIAAPTNQIKTWTDYAGCLVVEGRGTYRDHRDRIHAVGPGCFVHHLPGRFHHIERDGEGWLEYTLACDGGTYRSLHRLGLVDEDAPVLRVGAATDFADGIRHLRDWLPRAEDRDLPRISAHIVGLVAGIADRARRGAATDTIGLDTLRERLGRDLDQALSLEDLAAEAGLSYAHFRRRFREAFGQAPGAYRLERRLDQARLMLCHGDAPIAAIAAAVGYDDPFVFSRQFSRRYRLPPSRYRAAHGAR